MTLMQDMKICGPEGRDCIEKKSAEPFNCSLTCDGIYADIYRKASKIEDGIDKDMYTDLTSEYLNFKRERVKHFEFNNSGSASNFGVQVFL